MHSFRSDEAAVTQDRVSARASSDSKQDSPSVADRSDSLSYIDAPALSHDLFIFKHNFLGMSALLEAALSALMDFNRFLSSIPAHIPQASSATACNERQIR